MTVVVGLELDGRDRMELRHQSVGRDGDDRMIGMDVIKSKCVTGVSD